MTDKKRPAITLGKPLKLLEFSNAPMQGIIRAQVAGDSLDKLKVDIRMPKAGSTINSTHPPDTPFQVAYCARLISTVLSMSVDIVLAEVRTLLSKDELATKLATMAVYDYLASDQRGESSESTIS